ncbi:hypothetical protein HDR58_08460 [bacterium]|nr:hypothetical protein [bacterium]
MKRDYDNFKYTCLFGGGAIRGAAHVGVIKALESLGIQTELLAGSSVGSMIAALYAVGYTSDELADVFLSVNFELFRDISLGFNQKFALSKGEVFLDWFRDLIERKYYGEAYLKGQCAPVKFKDIDKSLVIISTNMKNFTCKEFSTFITPDFEIAMAVRISCCLPGLMRAVNLDDELLVDGDLMKGKPMWLLSSNIQNSSERILEVRLEGSFSGTDQNPLEYVNGMYTCMTASETSFIKDLYGNRDKYDYLVIDTGDVIVIDFNYPTDKRQAIIDNGYKQAIDYFTRFLPIKKQRLLNIYLHILDELRKVQSFMLMKKYTAAKNSTSELFIYLAKVKDLIDDDVYQSLSAFQKIVFANITAGLLGRSKCIDRNSVSDLLNTLISDLTLRGQGLENYINKFSV